MPNHPSPAAPALTTTALLALALLTAPACHAGAAGPAPAPAPNPLQQARAEADTLYAHRHWVRAAEAYRRLDALPGGPPYAARYNMACAFARGGQRDSALASLGVLMDRGYRQPEALLADTDFASLHDDAAFLALVERARANANPCASRPESRQFDFWVGDWDVFDRQRGLGRAGSSHVELILGQCVVFENWTGGQGGHGKSFNVWNQEAGCWQQTWVDDSGRVTYYDRSELKDGALTFYSTGRRPDGTPQRVRLSFTPLGPDEVRQFSEVSTDGGSTWTVNYDLLYRRRK